MGISSEWHEDYNKMSDKTRDFSRAIKSIIEELEAVDWYTQRAEQTVDKELAKILIHNRDEEIEHAMMSLEWLRRNHPIVEEMMKKFLFKTAPITEIEGD